MIYYIDFYKIRYRSMKNIHCIIGGLVLNLILWIAPLRAQDVETVSNPYSSYFEEAYSRYPSIPEGLLEAVAFNNTRIRHIRPTSESNSCQGLPEYYGVMGLVEDGKGYFNNTLDKIARLSGYSKEEIKQDPRNNILAYAASYSALQRSRRLMTRSVENHGSIFDELSEIPNDRTDHNDFARDQQFYGILHEMENPHTVPITRSNKKFDYNRIFGRERYQILSAPTLQIHTTRNRSLSVNESNDSPFRCTREERLADYTGALWSTANSRNYGSREGEKVLYVAIHTIQGSYASAISWFKNPNARVSTHYVIRASDGQVTQMVCESDRAFHIRRDNHTSIGIEHEGFIADGAAWYTQQMYESSAELVRDIALRHGIDPQTIYGGPPTEGIRSLSNDCYRIKGHQHFRENTHIDPGPFWDWDKYYRLINGKPEVQQVSQANGKIEVLDYSPLSRKAYVIDPPGNSPVEISFSRFDLEGTMDNPFDYLEVFDGKDHTGRRLGRFSGNKLPGKLMANSGSAYIEFRSDCRQNAKGFSLNYTTSNIDLDCPPLQAYGVQNAFALGATVKWEANTNADEYVIKVKRQNSDDAWTQFQASGEEHVLTGLSANSSFDWEMQSICRGNKISPPVGGTFQTPDIGRVGSPKVYIVSATKGIFTDSGGEISGYSTEEAYIYSIRPQQSGRIKLSFSEFDTERDYDILTIYDGLNTNARIIGNYSGQSGPFDVTSTGNALTIKFVSDKRTQGSGWKANWGIMEQGGGPSTDNPLPEDGSFDPGLAFTRLAPETRPLLINEYRGDIQLTFEDKSNLGRGGVADRFYLVAQENDGLWKANTRVGFFLEEFAQGFQNEWKKVSGQWVINNQRLYQLDESETNSNIYVPLSQTSSHTYLYHWTARMSGNANNQRSGIHFFSNAPDATQRGDSYFVWVRNAGSGDKVEIYKTTNNQFEKKMEKGVNIETGAVYDYKTIYNPVNGRIEVYINNTFVLSWTDPNPIKKGNGISLRNGNCIFSIDNIRVYKSRSDLIRITSGTTGGNDIVFEPGQSSPVNIKVYSAVVDPPANLQSRWSRVVSANSRVLPGVPDNTADTGTGGEEDIPEETIDNGILKSSYKDDFMLDLAQPGYFMLPANYNGQRWLANTSLGFFYDDFNETGLSSMWTPAVGTWIQQGGTLVQGDENSTNSNLSALVTQFAGEVYVFHWKAKILTTGDNKRFGLHFFSSDGIQTNRGDSYLVWFRNYTDRQDKVEIYRSENDQLNIPRAEGPIDIQDGQWYDCKVYFDSGSGLIEVFINDRLALRWKDDILPFRKGAYISLRTGSSQVQFEDVRVYKQLPTSNPIITVGNKTTDMIRFKSSGNQPAMRIFLTRPQDLEMWGKIEMGEAKIR